MESTSVKDPNGEPLWRKALCWGATILFLTIPVGILIARIVAAVLPHAELADSLNSAKYTIPYFQSLTALVFGLAGLNVVDRRLNGKSVKKEKEN